MPSNRPAARRAAAALAARIHGPREVRLAGRMMLRLQEGLVYIPPAQGERLLRAVGKIPRQRLLGVLVVGVSDTTWVAVLCAKEQGMPGIPELGVAGWDHMPEQASFRLW